MLTPNPEFIQELIHIVNTSPYPRHMSMRLAAIDIDRADIELETGPQHIQPYGIVHGGVLATLIDTATFWAAFMRIPEDAGLVNIDLKLNYLKPVISGRLKAEGRSIRSGNSISYAEARVLDTDGELIAHGTSTLMTLPDKGLRMKARKFTDIIEDISQALNES
ncbi:MAG: PaaI family thioesterase [Pseudomonadota bacterium]|nr:PaaI family thioesterase [Pseudomonadota bacterium]MBU1398304.1 PaaI family thioesterase [Pseudomonadota bacterium]MBU1571009.1 PaaI family thioesterase [Pseudomonadota bacterium]